MRSLLLLLLIVSTVLIFLGALGKIQHWPVANYLMAGGMIVEIGSALGLVLLSWKARNGR